MAEALTYKRQQFVLEYIKDFNGARAAIASGYSKRTASQIANSLLKSPAIKEALKAVIAEKHMSAEEVLSRLAEMARGDMGDFVKVNNGEVIVEDWDGIVKSGKSRIVKKLTNTKEGVSIELYDAKDALDKIGKYHALFTDVTVKVERELEGALKLLEQNLDKATFAKIVQILSTSADERAIIIEKKPKEKKYNTQNLIHNKSKPKVITG